MNKFHLNCENISTRPELHDKIALEFGFPEWYGKNLDALHDCLLDISTDTLMVVENFNLLEEKLGRYALNFKKVLSDSSAENNFLDIEFKSPEN